MKLSDIIVTDAIIPVLQATDRNGVIREMVKALSSCIGLDGGEADTLSKAIIKRESEGSTGFGKGVAIPHAKHPAIKSVVATIGRSKDGVEFAALDRAPVYCVILVLSPTDQPDQHLVALESCFQHLQNHRFRNLLLQASTTEEIIELLHEGDTTG